MRLIGYAYEAAEHCHYCAIVRFGSITTATVDSEGNPPSPIFDTDESESEVINCDSCGEELS